MTGEPVTQWDEKVHQLLGLARQLRRELEQSPWLNPTQRMRLEHELELVRVQAEDLAELAAEVRG
jgi:hypothetical protein